MSKRLVAIILTVIIVALTVIPVMADEYSANPYGDPYLIRCTVYTAKPDAITFSGKKVREGIVAGREDWQGLTVIMYENNDGKVGDLIGYYEVLDTGAGIDTDGDGKGDSLIKGTSIDVFRSDLDRCYEWIDTYGDYVFIQLVKAVG